MKTSPNTLRLLAVLAMPLIAAAGCAQQPPAPVTEAAPAPMPMVGNDRDAHGCIGSAGYTWCARESACVRWWELTAAKGLAKEPAAAEAYCQAAKP